MKKKDAAHASQRRALIKHAQPFVQPYTRDSVKRAIVDYFPTADADEILKLLDEYGQESHEQERERVQTDILYLSEGHLDKLRQYLHLAKTDYRDVLMMAEYSNPK